MKVNTFTKNKVIDVIACDTETHTYIDGIKMSTEDICCLFAERDEHGKLIHDTAWARKHVTVDAYAWLVSDGVDFAWLESFEEFTDFCCEHRVKTAWWYNAKFDFAFIDYQILSNGWTSTNGKRMTDRSYNSLHGDQGQRYKLTLAKAYNHSGRDQDRHKHIYKTSHYDFMNIFGGGLARNLKAFNVVDYDGNEIRKLEMDYQGEIDDNAVQYMKNDVYGLFHLVRIADEFLQKECNVSLLKEDPDIMTAGALAKLTLLESMYGLGDKKANVKRFQQMHKMTVELDQSLRDRYLYTGGKTIANKDYIGKLITRKIYYYDRNSMYPSEMYIMPDLIGGLLPIDAKWFDHYRALDYQIIYELTDYDFILKDGALAVLYCPFNREYVDDMNSDDYFNRSLLMFDFELDTLAQFYDIHAKINKGFAIKKSKNQGISNFIKKWYDQKAQAKKTNNGVLSQFAKLMLNSSYGKLSQNPQRVNSHREISEDTGAVHLVEDDTNIDEKSLLSVIMGAYITAKARCSLMNFMIEVCGSAIATREHIFYCDTDSIQTDLEYAHPDAYKLGGWKLEEDKPFKAGKWLAPKTYVLVQDNNGKHNFVVHSKGVATKVMSKLFNEKTSLEEMDDFFHEGKSYQTLCGLNVVGGKALLPLEKQLCRIDNMILHDSGIEVRGE